MSGTPKRRAAVFTIAQNEPVFLPIWARYYRRHFAADDCFVLDHDSTDPTTVTIAKHFHRVPIHRNHSFDHNWLRTTVQQFQRFLLQSYELVLFTEIDEIVATDPVTCPGGLREYLATVPDDQAHVRCTGWEIVQQPDEAAIDWHRPLLAQRAHGAASRAYSKPLLARVPLDWQVGFHHAENVPPFPEGVDPRLLLLHLHRIDFGYCLQRNQAAAARKWSADDVAVGAGAQNRIVDVEALRTWFYGSDAIGGTLTMSPLPAQFAQIVV